MKSRQFIWLLLFSTALNLNCFALSSSIEEPSVLKKVFILIRSEENQLQLEKFKEQINNDLNLQNIVVEIETYRRSEPLPQAKIFRTAYSGDYDVLLLIEQIAKYSIDNRVTNSMIKMGGKYKIQSYKLKETPYTWVDHGNSNCNISVDLSLKAFTERILSSIDIQPAISLQQNSQENGKTNIDNEMVLYNELIEQFIDQRKKTELLLMKIEKLKNRIKIKADGAEELAQLNSN
jgi:hypothetical protein